MFLRKFKSNSIGTHPARRAERHPTDGFSCELGKVADISTGGMRIQATSKSAVHVGEVRNLKLRTPGGTIAVKGQIVRLARKGLRHYDIGVRFLEMRHGTATVLEALARFGFVGPGVTSPGGFSTSGAAHPPIANAPTPPDPKPAPDLPDYYMLLGIGPAATESDIQAAFRIMAWRFHPDVSDDPDGRAKFTLVHEAYKILRDPAQRQDYDMKRSA